MKRAVIAATVTSLLASGAVAVVATAAPSAGDSWTGLRAGVGVVDASWHLGASAGQYGSNEYDGAPSLSDEWDPNVEHVKKRSADGMASRLSIRAIVLKDSNPQDPPVALVKVDNYLAQDLLTRRVAQILAADGSKVTYDNILMSATHDHNSPYYSTPAAGTPGSPPTVGPVRQLPTDGYGWDSGPATQWVSIRTVGLLLYGDCTGTPLFAPPIACQAA